MSFSTGTLATLPLDGQGGAGLPGRGRSRSSCCLVTRALAAGSSGFIFSTSLVVWMLEGVLRGVPLGSQGRGGLLGRGAPGWAPR